MEGQGELAPSTDRLAEELRERNLRLTPQRLAVWEFLRSSRVHPTVEEIYEGVRRTTPGISLATVYNTVNLLVELGWVRELPAPDARRFDGDPRPHQHVVCRQCGKIVDYHGVDLSPLRREVEEATGFTVVSERLELLGACPDCREAGGAPGSGEAAAGPATSAD